MRRFGDVRGPPDAMGRIYAPRRYASAGRAGVRAGDGPWLGSGLMDVLIHLFVGLHIIGIAALLGGFLTQMKAMGQGTARFVPAMLHGALTMLVTGVALVGLNEAQSHHVDTVKIGVKLAVLIVILGLVYVKRDDEKVDKSLFGLVGLLTMVNIFIAVLWT